MHKSDIMTFAASVYEENQVLELEHAVDYATKHHHGQKRKSGAAYITHPLAVAYNLIDWGMDVDTVLAGVLHDTVEDTVMSLEALRAAGFTSEVVDAIEALTKQKNEVYFDYINRVSQNPIAICVKLADLEDNMDPSQLNVFTQKEADRTEKYHRVYNFLRGIKQ